MISICRLPEAAKTNAGVLNATARAIPSPYLNCKLRRFFTTFDLCMGPPWWIRFRYRQQRQPVFQILDAERQASLRGGQSVSIKILQDSLTRSAKPLVPSRYGESRLPNIKLVVRRRKAFAPRSCPQSIKDC